MEKRIYYHDTDAGGVVYYANYLKYLEEARTIFLEEQGLDIQILRNMEFFYAVRSCNIRYKAPARYGDTIVCRTALTKTTAVQMIFDQKIYHKDSDQLLIEAEVVLVSLSKDFKPKPIPEDLKSRLM